MNYPDGQEIRLGDKVKLWDGCIGEVVCSFDTQEYSSAYPKVEWEYLKNGVLIFSNKGGLIHYIEPESSMQLLSRK